MGKMGDMGKGGSWTHQSLKHKFLTQTLISVHIQFLSESVQTRHFLDYTSLAYPSLAYALLTKHHHAPSPPSSPLSPTPNPNPDYAHF